MPGHQNAAEGKAGQQQQPCAPANCPAALLSTAPTITPAPPSCLALWSGSINLQVPALQTSWGRDGKPSQSFLQGLIPLCFGQIGCAAGLFFPQSPQSRAERGCDTTQARSCRSAARRQLCSSDILLISPPRFALFLRASSLAALISALPYTRRCGSLPDRALLGNADL